MSTSATFCHIGLIFICNSQVFCNIDVLTNIRDRNGPVCVYTSGKVYVKMDIAARNFSKR